MAIPSVSFPSFLSLAFGFGQAATCKQQINNSCWKYLDSSSAFCHPTLYATKSSWNAHTTGDWEIGDMRNLVRLTTLPPLPKTFVGESQGYDLVHTDT